MNKYRVPVKLIFTGTYDVIAEDEETAKELVLENGGGILDHAENNTYDELIPDWDINIHSDIECDEDEEVELIEENIDEDENDEDEDEENDDDEMD